MKKDIMMKRSSFLTGTFITTTGIILSKVLGALYVIPFHAIIGVKGGALYSYAYTIYASFLSLSTAGIPLAISRIVAEYRALGYQRAKKQAFVLGKRMSQGLGLFCFLLLFVFAPLLATAILGGVVGGNTVKDVTLVIRVIATAILFVPLLSVYRGFFEGHRMFGISSFSQVLEQFIRVFIIVLGSFVFVRVFNVGITLCVVIALLGAPVGALSAYVYLFLKKKKNDEKFHTSYRLINEPFITNKIIMKKIICYAVPFIFIDLFKSLYGYVDMLSLVKFLVKKASFSAQNAEMVYSIFSTWAQKFNMIILAISSGVVVSLIPNLAELLTKKEQVEIQKKIIQGLNVLLYLTIPLTFGISFLSKSIWNLFYGNSVYGPNILSYYIFVGLAASFFSFILILLQSLKEYKSLFICLLIGLLLKIVLNNKLLFAFLQMRFPAYYGSITATIIGYFVPFIIGLIILQKKYFLSFEGVIKNFIDVMCSAIIMVGIMFLIGLFLPTSAKVQIFNLFYIVMYTIIGAIVYFLGVEFSGVTKRVFGANLLFLLRKK